MNDQVKSGRPKIPGGSMRISKAKARWRDVREAAQSADPAKMMDAVMRFEGIANTMFLYWSGKAFGDKSE